MGFYFHLIWAKRRWDFEEQTRGTWWHFAKTYEIRAALPRQIQLELKPTFFFSNPIPPLQRINSNVKKIPWLCSEFLYFHTHFVASFLPFHCIQTIPDRKYDIGSLVISNESHWPLRYDWQVVHYYISKLTWLLLAQKGLLLKISNIQDLFPF